MDSACYRWMYYTLLGERICVIGYCKYWWENAASNRVSRRL